MGHLQEDGSILVPLDCVLEAAQSLGAQTLTEAAETFGSGEVLNLLRLGRPSYNAWAKQENVSCVN